MTPLPCQRHLFNIPEHIAYFNCAYNSPQLNAAAEALHSGVNMKSHPWERTPENFFNDAETIRQLAAELFGGDPDGYAVVPAASYGVSTAARAIEPLLRPSDRILIMTEEFPSNVFPWKRVCQETRAVINMIPRPEYKQSASAILEKIDDRVKVVAVSTCHWTNGANIDLAAIAQVCRAHGIILVVDATQTLGAVPFSMAEIQPDFLAAAGYKWLLCPYGFSLLYVAEKWRKSRPLEETWLARLHAEDFASLANYSDTYMPGARRFDVGEKCTPTILPGAIAALRQIKAWGTAEIAHTLAIINRTIAQELEQLGFQVPEESKRSPHMFGAFLPQKYNGNLVNELKREKIYISQRGNALRFAPHLHITDDDLARLRRALRTLLP